jgi:hypothetical protein
MAKGPVSSIIFFPSLLPVTWHFWEWIPEVFRQQQLQRLLDELEAHDDVQQLFHNALFL